MGWTKTETQFTSGIDKYGNFQIANKDSSASALKLLSKRNEIDFCQIFEVNFWL
jgi:hypothetical protein